MKKYIWAGLAMMLVASTAFVYSDLGSTSVETVEAQSCAVGDTTGNLYGYATTTNLGRIYMSTDSWNDEESSQTTVNFAVSYNRQTGTWSGRGWSKDAGWVDFGQNNADLVIAKQALFEDVSADRDGWGNMTPTIELSNVRYNSDPGAFVGVGTHSAFTGAGNDERYDDYVGVGDVDFSNVQIVESPCNEYVDVTINNANSIISSQCDITDPTIRWSTTNVVPGSCVASGSLWQTAGSKSDQNLSGERGNDVTATNTPQTVRLTCVGAGSQTEVYGEAYARCGEVILPDCPDGQVCDPTTGQVIPQFKEV